MKKLILLPVLQLAFMLSLHAQGTMGARVAVPETKIIYHKTDLDQALKIAAKEGKMVMLQFQEIQVAAYRYTVKNALLNDTVSNFINTHFINLLIDLADTLHNQAIIRKYHVTGWEFVFLDKNGADKHSFGGGWSSFDAEHFTVEMNDALMVKDRDVNAGVIFEHGDIPAALTAAVKSNKLVLVDCYTTWCVPCAEMANNVFPLKQMGDYLNPKFVADKLDMESPEGKELNKKYKVIAYPTFLILNNKGEEIGRVVGGMEANLFISKIKEALGQK